MKQLSASLIALLVFVVLAPVSALADTWGEPINTPDRFIKLTPFTNQAVFDKETGLVWEQSPSTSTLTWLDAQAHCNDITVGNRKGWRLPTIQELASLIDPTVPFPGPALPAGHPFSNVQQASNVQNAIYWSATTSANNPAFAWVAFFDLSGVNTQFKLHTNFFVWCVRGGQGVDLQ